MPYYGALSLINTSKEKPYKCIKKHRRTIFNRYRIEYKKRKLVEGDIAKSRKEKGDHK